MFVNFRDFIYVFDALPQMEALRRRDLHHWKNWPTGVELVVSDSLFSQIDLLGSRAALAQQANDSVKSPMTLAKG
jgi:hypothetical protein